MFLMNQINVDYMYAGRCYQKSTVVMKCAPYSLLEAVISFQTLQSNHNVALYSESMSMFVQKQAPLILRGVFCDCISGAEPKNSSHIRYAQI